MIWSIVASCIDSHECLCVPSSIETEDTQNIYHSSLTACYDAVVFLLLTNQTAATTVTTVVLSASARMRERVTVVTLSSLSVCLSLIDFGEGAVFRVETYIDLIPALFRNRGYFGEKTSGTLAVTAVICHRPVIKWFST